ncbi:hypothetical protein HPB49_014272 [Dermacentor silvarum]|uniref:Uncharacterized protein n=1 Tax=Dermacentor silvarum TaxID=543639 RepID=A0ACB8DPH5_DERSI|nr:hypothetical protein HPB49_014272 [Dermacentor silvarum]
MNEQAAEWTKTLDLLNSGDMIKICAPMVRYSKKTVDFCQKLEAAGVSFITVHGRTKDQRSEPVNIDAIRTVKDALQIPVVANGDVTSKRKAEEIYQATGVNGVMAARGMLDNPAMFSGFKHTPVQCVEDWLQLSAELGCPLTQFHHHLMFMLDHVLSRSEKRIFNALTKLLCDRGLPSYCTFSGLM